MQVMAERKSEKIFSNNQYKEIAQEMKMNPRTIDAIRDTLFDKLDAKSRVGLAMYSIRHGLISF